MMRVLLLLLLLLLLWAPEHATTSDQASPAIVLETPSFSLSLDPSTCMATATYNRPARHGSALTSRAVPFLEFYNRVADAREQNLDACTSVARVPQDDESLSNSVLLRVSAAHAAGSVDIAVTQHEEHLLFEVQDLSRWLGADPVEKHLAFGEYWHGMDGLDNVSAPVVMGKLQGPFGTPGSAESVAAGFMSITNSSYYRYIFYAQKGQRLAFAFCPTLSVAQLWKAVGESQGLSMMDNANRHKSWWWSDWSEANRAKYAKRARTMGIDILVNTGGWHRTAQELVISEGGPNSTFPSGINATAAYFAAQGLSVGLHMHPDIVWPCVDSEGLDCLSTGVGISPMYLDCPECMVPEGLAPTFRSGIPGHGGTTEDIGYWWGHDKQGTIARLGNPKPCGQGTCNAGDWAEPWGANMSLFGGSSSGSAVVGGGCGWSKLGVYRSGGAIGFDASEDGCHGVVPHYDDLSTAQEQLTLGLTVHKESMELSKGRECLVTKAGVFSLCFVEQPPRSGLVWNVSLDSGGSCSVNATEWSSSSAITSSLLNAAAVGIGKDVATSIIVKATFNSSSGLKLFLNGNLAAANPCTGSSAEAAAAAGKLRLASNTSDLIFGAESVGLKQQQEQEGELRMTAREHLVASQLTGSLEEIYLKNASAENRKAYLFSDDNRKMGTFLIDLSRAPGRRLFSQAINAVLDEFNPAAVQYDGFEKLQLIAGQDFSHSSKTFSSGLWRGNPTPDWYHYEGWPLRWGIGILQGIEAAHAAMNSNTAVECSFMAPGLGPWRPDMAPYVDEHGPDLVQLGLEWHSKMLLRIEIAGTIINSYDTYTRWFETEGPFPVDYFLGGLITGGASAREKTFGMRFSCKNDDHDPRLAFQPSGGLTQAVAFDEQVGRWMARYKRFGHAAEDGVRTLVFDDKCCHIQGICEWVACRDAVLSKLSGGADASTNATGLYVGGTSAEASPLEIPPEYLSNRGTLLVFLAHNISSAALNFGAPSDTRATIVPMSATNLTTTRSLTLGGGWWELAAQDVALTTTDENGTVISGPQLLFGEPVTGSVSYKLAIDHPLARSAGSMHFVFEKKG